MTRSLFCGAATAALLAGAAPGWSLTAEEAWAGWQSAAAAYDQTVTAESETSADGRLTVSGVRFAAEAEGVSLEGTIAEVVFAEQGDGSVAITMSESYPMRIAFDTPEGDSGTLALTIAHPGLTMTAMDADSGSAFTYSAPTMTITLDELMAEDEARPAEATLQLTEVSGRYAATTGDTPGIDSALDAASMAFDLTASELEDGGTLTVSLAMADLTSTSMGAGSSLFDMTNLPEMMAAGFSSAGTVGFGATSFAMAVADVPETFSAEGTMSSGGIEVDFGSDRMTYGVSYDDFRLAFSGSEIPFPEVTGGLGGWTTRLSMPVAQTEAPQPFDLRVALEDLTIGDEIWGMFDPGQALSRDPATLIVDIAGQARWLVDIFDEAAMNSPTPPVEVSALEISELRLDVAGAELTGSGDVTVDNTTTAPNGMPAADGSAIIRLTGGNMLLQRLVQMGLLPQDQAMMTQMMVGMIARPGDAEDELVSEIEIRPDGTVLANGQPLPF